jgi:hypothetical protein
MKPKPTTREDEQKAALCDMMIDKTARLLVEEHGVPIVVLLDRLLTFAGAHAANTQGSPNAAKVFRQLADRIDAGIFHVVTGEGDQKGARH